MDERNLSDLLNDPLFSDYLFMNDNSLRFAISRISAQCEAIEIMLDEYGNDNGNEKCPDVRENLDDIISMCFRLMQIAELHHMIMMTDPKNPSEKEVFALDDLIGKIAENCSYVKNNRCVFSATGEKNIYLQMNKEMLIFLIMCYIRRSVAGGASEIALECGKKEGLPYIDIEVKSEGKSPIGMMDDFFLKRLSELTATLSQALDCTAEYSDSRMTIVFSKSCISRNFTLHAPVFDSGSRLFNIYSTMLNDLFSGD